MDHPKKTKLTSLKVHQSKQEVSNQRHEPLGQASTSASRNTVQNLNPNIAITSKEQILSKYPDIFESIGRFPHFAMPHTSQYEHHTKTNSM